MPMVKPNRKCYIEEIINCLAYLSFNVKGQNSICLFDLNRISEDVYCEILNSIFEWDLKNVNSVKKNAKAIDLIDGKSRIIVQVSSEKSIGKVKDSLRKLDAKKYKGYTFKFLSLVSDPPKGWTDSKFKKNIPEGIQFDCEEDILGPQKIISTCNSMETKKLARVYEACLENFHNSNENEKSRPSVTLDAVKMFISSMAETVKFECHIRGLCNEYREMKGESFLRKDIFCRIKNILSKQLRQCFIDVDSSMIDLRFQLLGDHELLEKMRNIVRLHSEIDDEIVEQFSRQNILNIQHAIESEMKIIVQTLKLFAQKLHIDEVDLNTEFCALIQE